MNFFSSKNRSCVARLSELQAYITKYIPPLKPKYSYANESGINPAYQDINHRKIKLHQHEKRIWVLRSDFILATGIKNAYQAFNYTGMQDAFCSSIHTYINWDDRYGHPSLAVPEGDYDGSVFYAGYICQKERYLQVYLSSGRFERHDLNAQQTLHLETYLAILFMQTYGEQEIIVHPGVSDTLHPFFFQNQAFPDQSACRYYSLDTLETSLSRAMI